MGSPLHAKQQAGWGTSPWSRRERIGMALWRVVYAVLFRPTPKPLNAWRLWLLRRFGAEFHGKPFVNSSAIIRIPWLLTMFDKAALGEHAEVYNLARITLRERCTVAQHAYLCAGTHDLADPALTLVVGEIDIGADVFIGVRALVLPGVTIGEGSVVGAGSVVPKDVPAWMIGAGNPWRAIKPREWPNAPATASAPAPSPAGAARSA